MSFAATRALLRSTAWLAGGLTLAAGCPSRGPSEPSASAAPHVLSAEAAPNPHNVLSALVAVSAENADSARVLYLAERGPVDSTPYVLLAGGRGTIATLGLRAETGYRSVVQAAGAAGVAQSDTFSFTTPSLPDPLGRVRIATAGAGGPGLTLAAVPVDSVMVVALAFDSAGAIRWYRRFDGRNAVSGELKQQPNGNFTLYVGASTGSQKARGYYVEFTPAGDSVRAFTVAEPRYVDGHELLVTGAGPDERIHLFTYEHRTTDIRRFGGAPDASLAGHQLVRLRPDGTTEFEWNAWDHLALDDWIEPPQPGYVDPPDFDHPNSIAFDRDGNYIVSMRHLGQILKIDARSGAVLWRLGGARGDFAFVNDPLNGFSAQHSARVLADGHLLLYDNGTRHRPPESRAVEYALDPAARTATLVWQFRHAPPIWTEFTGSVQRLAGGNTLIAYAWVGHATEARPDGSVAWEADVTIDGAPAVLYRMVRVASLYRPAAP